MGEDIDIDSIFNIYDTMKNIGEEPLIREEETGEEEEENWEWNIPELDYKGTFSDMQRISFGDVNIGKLTGVSKFLITEEDTLRYRLYQATQESNFTNITEEKLNDFRKYLSKTVEGRPGVTHMNIPLLTLASYFLWDRGQIDKSHIKNFLKDKTNVVPADFVRYLTFVKKLKVQI